jgi:hypothetical protein
MKSSILPGEVGDSRALNIQPSGSNAVAESTESEPLGIEESSISLPLHPLGVKPAGNQYTATRNARHKVGSFQILPDEILALFLEYLDSQGLILLGSTCKFLYAFCRTEDLWKALFIE